MRDDIFIYYRSKATEAVATVERMQASISSYAAQVAKSLGDDGRSAVVSLELSKDRPFSDLVADRNRYVQLAIMYSNMALLHKE